MIDPYTDLEINCRAASSRSSRPAGTQNPGVTHRLRQHAADLRPAAITCPSTRAIRSQPVDVNGINKTAGEWYHLLYSDVYGLRATRPAPDEHLRPADARQGRPADLPRHLDPTRSLGAPSSIDLRRRQQRRDFNYVDDAVDAFLLAARATRPPGRSSTSAARRRSPCASSPSCWSSSTAAAAPQLDPVPGRPQGDRHRRLLRGLLARSSASSAGDRRCRSATASRRTLAFYREHGATHYWDETS